MDVLGKANIRDTVNFSLYERTQSLIKTNFNGCKILGIVDAGTVEQFGADPYGMHANVYGTLPPGTPVSADDYNWLKVKLANGDISFVGVPYIIPSTMQVITGATTAFYVENTNQDVIAEIVRAIASTGNTVSKVINV
jgi:hypothetical protein